MNGLFDEILRYLFPTYKNQVAVWKKIYPNLNAETDKFLESFRHAGIFWTNEKFINQTVKVTEIDVNHFFPSIIVNDELPKGISEDITAEFKEFHRCHKEYPFEHHYAYFIKAVINFDDIKLHYFPETNTPIFYETYEFSFCDCEIGILEKCYPGFRIVKVLQVLKFKTGYSPLKRFIEYYFSPYNFSETKEQRKIKKNNINKFIGVLSKPQSVSRISFPAMVIYLWAMAKVKILSWFFYFEKSMVLLNTDALVFRDKNNEIITALQKEGYITDDIGNFKIKHQNEEIIIKNINSKIWLKDITYRK